MWLVFPLDSAVTDGYKNIPPVSHFLQYTHSLVFHLMMAEKPFLNTKVAEAAQVNGTNVSFGTRKIQVQISAPSLC